MNDYIKRLISCGFSQGEAAKISNDFIKTFGENALNEFVTDYENGVFEKCGNTTTLIRQVEV